MWTKVTTEITPPTRWHKWTKAPGCSAEGVLVAVREGRYNSFAILQQEDGAELNVPLKGYAGGDGKKTGEVVASVPEGRAIKLVYIGRVPGKRGAPRAHYDVYVQESGDGAAGSAQ